MNTDKNIDNLNNISNNSAKTPMVLSALALGAGILTPSVAIAGLIVTDINVTINDGNGYALDVDGNGDNDMYFYADSGASYGYLKNWNGVSASTDGKYAHMFNAGDSVDASWFDGTNGQSSSWGTHLYDGGNSGTWGTIGAHGYLGFSFDDGNGARYGWLELTRGSITIGKMALQDTAGIAAAIPGASSVPEPTSLLLMASGALGLLGMRRRNKLTLEQKSH